MQAKASPVVIRKSTKTQLCNQPPLPFDPDNDLKPNSLHTRQLPRRPRDGHYRRIPRPRGQRALPRLSENGSLACEFRVSRVNSRVYL